MKFSEMPYNRVDIDAVIKKLDSLIKEQNNANSKEEAISIHKKYYDLMIEEQTNITLCNVRNAIDTQDPFYEKEQAFYDENLPKFYKKNVEYQESLVNSKFKNDIEEFIGSVAIKNIELSMKSTSNDILELQKEENLLITKYEKLIASAKIDWEGEVLNLSLMKKYQSSKDREIRRKAYNKVTEFFVENEEELDDIYDKLVKNRTKQAKILGYDNFVELGYNRMFRNSYRREEVEKFRKQIIEEFVPYTLKLHEKRRKNLEVDKLSYVDEGIYYKNGNPEPNAKPDEILEKGRQMYSKMHHKTKEFMNFMMENELFDVYGRKTKRAGGFMTYFHKYKSPFVFANFNGTHGDIDVITHECGHAFQGYLSGKDPILEHSDIGMETAEIHSMSMEFFTYKYMEDFFGSRSEDYLKMHFDDACIFIPYGTMVDHFQHIVYENPELTPKQRKEEWRKLEKIYKPYLDYENNEYMEQGGFWQKQLHIYCMPFYYIDYVLAQVCAIQYKIWLDKNYDEAFESYIKLCELSAKDFYPNLLKEVGLKVPFKDGVIKEIISELEK